MNYRRQITIFLVILLFPLLSLAASGLDIRFNPKDYVYICEANADRGYFDAVIHNVAFINRSEDSVTLDHATIDVFMDNKICRRIILTSEELQKSANRGHLLQGQGLLKLYDFYLQTGTFLGESITLTPTLQMNPRTAVISTSNYFTLKGIPDNFKITAYARTGKGKLLESSAILKAVHYKQANTFNFPLKGTWWVGAGADIYAHHRWVAFEEFGFDLVKVGENGLTYKNAGLQVEDYYCFNQDVVAAADGEVVRVQAGLPDDNAMLRQKNESQQEYNQRINASQFKMLKENFYHAAGNFIVIRHNGEEYSFYAHLKQGSIGVKKGEKVKRGQVIGKVGHSGNSTEPHLHFQISNGADPFLSRAVPVKFSNIHLFERSGDSFLRTGDIVRTMNE